MNKATNFITGVYLIRHRESGRVYVGSARHIPTRWSIHKRQLRNGVHHNPFLQRTWAIYGEEGFDWEIVERVEDVAKLIFAEQKWMDAYCACDSGTGFNAAKFAGDVPMRGRKHSEATKAKLSAMQQGQKHPLQVRKLKASQVPTIIKRVVDGEVVAALAEEYSVSDEAIRDVVRRRRWEAVSISEELENQRLDYISKMKERPNRVKGSLQWQAKLTEAQVVEIISMIQRGERGSDIARNFGVQRVTVAAIKSGRIWKHLTQGKIEAPIVKHRASKINPEDVPLIIEKAIAGKPCEVLAEEYGVGSQAMRLLINRKTWWHIQLSAELEEMYRQWRK